MMDEICVASEKSPRYNISPDLSRAYNGFVHKFHKNESMLYFTWHSLCSFKKTIENMYLK